MVALREFVFKRLIHFGQKQVLSFPEMLRYFLCATWSEAPGSSYIIISNSITKQCWQTFGLTDFEDLVVDIHLHHYAAHSSKWLVFKWISERQLIGLQLWKIWLIRVYKNPEKTLLRWWILPTGLLTQITVPDWCMNFATVNVKKVKMGLR